MVCLDLFRCIICYKVDVEVLFFVLRLWCMFVFIYHTNCRALLHFLDPDKFRSKDEFVQKYKNLSSFNEIEVLVRPFMIFDVVSDLFCSLTEDFFFRLFISSLIFTWN